MTDKTTTLSNAAKPTEPSSQTLQPGKIVEGRIAHVTYNHCIVELGQGLHGRLKKQNSLARDDSAALHKLDKYQPGQTIQVYLVRQAVSDGSWRVNERWAFNNPWLNLPLKKRDGIHGKITAEVENGYFVQLDCPDITVLLPKSQVPWSDGSTGDQPYIEGVPRLSFELGDHVRALIEEIHYPPKDPRVSICRLLDKRERDEEAFEHKLYQHSGSQQLQYTAHGDIENIKQLFKAQLPLQGKKILIVDDMKDALESQQLNFEANGAIVHTVLAGTSLQDAVDEVLTLLEREEHHLLLVDYSLPRSGEGLSLIKRLQTLKNPLPPLALFSGDSLVELNQNPQLGLYSVLSKPIHLKQVLELLSGNVVPLAKPYLSERQNAPDDKLMLGLSSKGLLKRLRVGDVRYVVLFHTTGDQNLEAHTILGKFPENPQDLNRLIGMTELTNLLKGYRREFTIGIEPGNDSLKKYSRHARFFAIGEDTRPEYILGLGWDTVQPVPEGGWAMFRDLLRSALQREVLMEQLNHRLGFMIQGQLVSSLAHEIRARFSPWVNYQQALHSLWELYRKTPDENERLALETHIDAGFTGMEQARGGLNALVDLLLGGVCDTSERFLLLDGLTQVQELCSIQLERHNVDLRIYGPVPELSLSFSPMYLIQPLLNLVLNSHKHMYRSTGGRVKLCISQSLDQNQRNWLMLRVEDNGAGISAHDVSRIFEPGFSRAVQAQERTGLGLYISRLLAREIGGDLLLAENWRGFGCAFDLKLPITL